MSHSLSRPAVLMAPGDPGEPTGGATATSAPATATPAAPAGGGLVPPVKPNMNSTGMAGFTDLTNTIAGWTLLGCVAGFILSGLVFVVGPSFAGLRHARQFGAIGMMASLGIAAAVGMAAGLVNLFYTMFSGS